MLNLKALRLDLLRQVISRQFDADFRTLRGLNLVAVLVQNRNIERRKAQRVLVHLFAGRLLRLDDLLPCGLVFIRVFRVFLHGKHRTLGNVRILAVVDGYLVTVLAGSELGGCRLVFGIGRRFAIAGSSVLLFCARDLFGIRALGSLRGGFRFLRRRLFLLVRLRIGRSRIVLVAGRRRACNADAGFVFGSTLIDGDGRQNKRVCCSEYHDAHNGQHGSTMPLRLPAKSKEIAAHPLSQTAGLFPLPCVLHGFVRFADTLSVYALMFHPSANYLADRPYCRERPYSEYDLSHQLLRRHAADRRVSRID